ncbi:MAG TPA: hypothetical protein VNT25_06735 [Allosphingosinicella sp.]|nr:hypothetical protein [Allosphingosinicella sp.]
MVCYLCYEREAQSPQPVCASCQKQQKTRFRREVALASSAVLAVPVLIYLAF